MRYYYTKRCFKRFCFLRSDQTVKVVWVCGCVVRNIRHDAVEVHDLESGGDTFFVSGVEAHKIRITVPNSVRGPMSSTEVHAQALTSKDGDVSDRMPDIPSNGIWDVVAILQPRGPVFPKCTVATGPIDPGDVMTVNVSKISGDSVLKVILGDRMVGMGVSDSNGDATISVRVPIQEELGPRLVAVCVEGTALTADCQATINTISTPVAIF